MSAARRRKPPNRVGCKPSEDVCVRHDVPLVCRHGCVMATDHKCKEYEAVRESAWAYIAKMMDERKAEQER